MILLDTSALYAMASVQDPRHEESQVLASRLADSRETLLVHTYVLCEAFSLIHRRRGLAVAQQVDAGLRGYATVIVDRALHDRAVARLRAGARSRVSLVDAVSFEVMRERDIDTAFAFDPDFEWAGFRLYSAKSAG